MYWAHPGDVNHDRQNYTLHQSTNGGATWEFVNRVYALGAGYSDALVVRGGNGGSAMLAMAFQKTFEPPVSSIEGGGYDMGLALLPLESAKSKT